MSTEVTAPGGLGRVGSRGTALLLAILVTLLWSSSYVLIKIGLEDLPPLTFAGLRYFIGFLSLLFLHRLQGRRLPRGLPPPTWRALIAHGLITFAIAPGAIFLSLSLLPVITANLIFQAGIPLMVALSAGLFLGEKTSGRQWLGVALTVAGVYLAFPARLGEGAGLGVVLALLSAACGAAANQLTRYLMRDPRMRATDMTMITAGIGSILLLAVGLAVEPAPRLSAGSIGLLLWLGVANTALAFTLWNLALRTLQALEAGVIATAQVIEVTLMAWIVLAEPLSAGRLLAALFILAGVILVQTPRRPAGALEAGAIAGPNRPVTGPLRSPHGDQGS